MSAYKQYWTDDCLLIDPDGRHEGRTALSLAIESLQEQTPDFVFTELGSIHAHYGIGRMSWGYGLYGERLQLTGMVVAVIVSS